ncbi:phospholipid-translocating ATPase [Ephemerocybe angulata]|uniref:Phospholipid-transporting ATPase n=1 Tax=Ephemerocybe angulata TaxID=980116 RepID=A0A8H6MGG3_9AGAR|nr:phospholipid-translocating ATPase [Tulosesus angulatus]
MSTKGASKKGKGTGLWAALRRLADADVGDLFSRKREPGPPRTVYANQALPQDYFDVKGKLKKEYEYITNQVITSKYTALTFVPRNILEQFRRVANLYFLAISILQFFPKFTTVAPGVVILPLVIILGITALKDGYEDYQRHQADRRTNYSKVKLLANPEIPNSNGMTAKTKTFVRRILPTRKPDPRSSFSSDATTVFSKTSRNSKETVATSIREPIEYDYDGNGSHWKDSFWEDVRVGDFVKIVEGEQFPADILICATSEEENVAFVETKNLDGETNLKSRRAVDALTQLNNAGECGNARNAFTVKCDKPDTDMYRLNAVVNVGGQEYAVDINNILLRGTQLKNTGWAIGFVLFTGEDTKIVMNSGGTPSKRSRVERQMNPQVIINLIIIAAVAVICAIADSMLQVKYYELAAPWLYGDNLSDDNPRINGLITWAYALLTFQDIVPISLYLSIEVVRTVQALFIYFDYDIYYKKTDQPTIARSWNLSDDLGQIEYIFSDKTGTLTQNQMIFRKCTIGGVAYRGEPDPLEDDDLEDDEGLKEVPLLLDEKDVEKSTEKLDVPIRIDLAPSSSSSVLNRTPSTSSLPQEDETFHFHDPQLQRDLDDAFNAEEGSSNAAHARHLNGFFTVLSLCHTVLTGVDPVTGEVTYKSQSPDEGALVQAAADVGYRFVGRDRETLLLRTPGSEELEKYELLNILEFTSARKRMSVVVRKIEGVQEGQPGNGRLMLLCKGADNVIFERLRPGADEMKAETEVHLSEFANTGLRTLTLAYKIIQEDEYARWSERYHQATIAMEDREEHIEEVSDELERDLRLLGATAIEDRLQDGVPETIADLKKAGIKIWVATGDKMETAIAIGKSTNLIGEQSNIVILRGGGDRSVPEQMVRAFQQFFPEVDVAREMQPRKSSSSRYEGDRIAPLRRIDTGMTDIVGMENGDRPGGFVLVVDGVGLLEAFRDEESKALLLSLSQQCEGVICCRVSPLQKALVVKLVKDGLGAMTLAIGDGANDVSMIQAADVGVGISGEEGLQAVNSSDYAIAQFKYLKKLLLVHGHWSYARNGTMILNFFYKNMLPFGIKFWFMIYSGWSANYVYDYIYVLFWNSIFTVLPVVGVGVFDRILDYHILMDVPELYRYGREGYWFSMRSFFVYMVDALVQSVVIYFIILYTYTSPTSRTDGYDINQTEFSTTMAMVGVMVANIYVGLNASAWTWWLTFTVFIGSIVLWVFTVIYSAIAPSFASTFLYGNNYFLFTSAYFWLCLPITFLVPLLPRYLFKYWKFSIEPTDIDILRAAIAKNPHQDWTQYSGPHRNADHLHDLAALKQEGIRMSRRHSSRASFASGHVAGRPSMDLRAASRTDMATGLTSVDRGFGFAMEEGGVEIRRIQTNISERRFGESAASGRRRGEKGKGTLRKIFPLRRSKVVKEEEFSNTPLSPPPPTPTPLSPMSPSYPVPEPMHSPSSTTYPPPQSPPPFS